MLVTTLLSPAGDSVAESAWRRHYRVLLATALPSPPGDGAAESHYVGATEFWW
jgi:hypothetical protein